MDNYEIYNERYTWSKYWNKYSATIKWFDFLIKKIVRYLDYSSVHNIIDIGCGDGFKTNLLSSIFINSKVLGLDFTDEGIISAKECYKNNKNLLFQKKDVMDINDENKYDLVTCFEVLEHIEDWKILLSKMVHISNKYLLISVPTGKMRDFEINYGHLRNFKKGEIEYFLKLNGCKPIKIFYAGFPFYSPLGRNWLNKNYYKHQDNISKDFTFLYKVFHLLVYISFRYFSFKSIGDQFVGLFERVDISTNSNGGG